MGSRDMGFEQKTSRSYGFDTLVFTDRDHTPYTKRAGVTPSVCVTDITFNRKSKWVQIRMEETTNGRTRTISTVIEGTGLDKLREYLK